MKKHHDINAEENSSKYHTGKMCIEADCPEKAGTAWSPHWCQKCNAERLDRITLNLEKLNQQKKSE